MRTKNNYSFVVLPNCHRIVEKYGLGTYTMHNIFTWVPSESWKGETRDSSGRDEVGGGFGMNSASEYGESQLSQFSLGRSPGGQLHLQPFPYFLNRPYRSVHISNKTLSLYG